MSLSVVPDPAEDERITAVRTVVEKMENDFALAQSAPEKERDWLLAWNDVMADLRGALGIGECTRLDYELATAYGWDERPRGRNAPTPWVVFDWEVGRVYHVNPPTLANAAKEAHLSNEGLGIDYSRHTAERWETAMKLSNAFNHGRSAGRAAL